MPHEVIMPALGMAQDTAQLVSWLKQSGDVIRAGEALMEVETDKAVMEVEAQADGVLSSISAVAGDQVPVGQVVAVILQEGETSPPAREGGSQAVPEGPIPSDGADADADADELPPGKNVIMPALGMAQDTGLIVAWRKDAGDAVSADDILLEVETDKSVMEVEAGHDGYLAAVLAQAQQEVPVGAVIAIISTDKPDAAVSRRHTAVDTPPATGTQEAASDAPRPPAHPPGPVAADAAALPGGRILASPKVRRLALERGLDLGQLVQAGVPQPFHVADLDTLAGLGDRPSSTRTSPDPATPAALQVRARVPANGCDDFMDWLEEQQLDLHPSRVWLSFATAALRQTTARATDTLVVRVERNDAEPVQFADADRSRLSQSPATPDELTADLLLRDLCASFITSTSLSVDSLVALTLLREHDTFVLSLDYRPGQLDDRQAIRLLTGFSERLAEPMLHLL